MNTVISNMQECINHVKTMNIKESWMKGAINENLETMVETMNLYECNPNNFWRGKFIKIYSQCMNFEK